MASFNKVILVGNLTRDPELRQAGSVNVAEIGLAVNRTWFDKASGQKREECDFIDVTFFGKLADVIAQYMKKGSPMLVEGRLKLETWEDKQSQQKRYKLKVIGESMQMLGSKDGGASRQTDAPPTESQQQEFSTGLPDGDIPFSFLPFLIPLLATGSALMT